MQTRIYLENPKWSLDLQLHKAWAEICEGHPLDFPDNWWQDVNQWIRKYTEREKQFPSISKLIRLKVDLLFICGGIMFEVDQSMPKSFKIKES